jgi:hypothetical protein
VARLTPVSIEYRRKASELGRQMEQAETDTERRRLASEAVRLIEMAKLEETLTEQMLRPVEAP